MLITYSIVLPLKFWIIIINRILNRSAVIIGRCGFHVLYKYPNHVSIFLYGDIAFRNNRIQKLYNVSKEAAREMIAQKDKDRPCIAKKITGIEWVDARNLIFLYTSKLNIDKTIEFILYYLKLREE